MYWQKQIIEMNGLNYGIFIGMATSISLSFGGVNRKSFVFNITGISALIALGRISYIFNFKDPNSIYDTACLLSLVALNTAVLSLYQKNIN